jgi:hypothetical protein
MCSCGFASDVNHTRSVSLFVQATPCTFRADKSAVFVSDSLAFVAFKRRDARAKRLAILKTIPRVGYQEFRGFVHLPFLVNQRGLRRTLEFRTTYRNAPLSRSGTQLH